MTAKKKKSLFTIFIIVAICFSLMACNKEITEGEVYEKEFKPAESILVLTPVVVSDGKNIRTMLIPIWHHYPDRWIIKIKIYDQEKDKWLYEKFYLSERAYDAINIGDWFIFDKNLATREEPCVKEREKN